MNSTELTVEFSKQLKKKMNEKKLDAVCCLKRQEYQLTIYIDIYVVRYFHRLKTL